MLSPLASIYRPFFVSESLLIRFSHWESTLLASEMLFFGQKLISKTWEMHFCWQNSYPKTWKMQFWGQKSIPGVWEMQFRIAKPIPQVVECWRKMRNHSAEMKSLIAKCAACFFSEKSNFQPGIGLFIFEKSNRKLRRILFFWKVQFPNRN